MSSRQQPGDRGRETLKFLRENSSESGKTDHRAMWFQPQIQKTTHQKNEKSEDTGRNLSRKYSSNADIEHPEKTTNHSNYNSLNDAKIKCAFQRNLASEHTNREPDIDNRTSRRPRARQE
jgi:hypothetical protein